MFSQFDYLPNEIKFQIARWSTPNVLMNLYRVNHEMRCIAENVFPQVLQRCAGGTWRPSSGQWWERVEPLLFNHDDSTHRKTYYVAVHLKRQLFAINLNTTDIEIEREIYDANDLDFQEMLEMIDAPKALGVYLTHSISKMKMDATNGRGFMELSPLRFSKGWSQRCLLTLRTKFSWNDLVTSLSPLFQMDTTFDIENIRKGSLKCIRNDLTLQETTCIYWEGITVPFTENLKDYCVLKVYLSVVPPHGSFIDIDTLWYIKYVCNKDSQVRECDRNAIQRHYKTCQQKNLPPLIFSIYCMNRLIRLPIPRTLIVL